jgi:hypothetical protein
MTNDEIDAEVLAVVKGRTLRANYEAVTGLSMRDVDKSLQRLKRHGKIEYVQRRWVVKS